MKLGEQIFWYRQKNNLTQADLARLLGVSTNYINLIENGHRSPGEKTAFLLENLLKKN